MLDEIICRCKAGNRDAMEQLYNHYANQVFKTAIIFTGDKTLAEDIVQESLIRVFAKISLYNEKYSFDAWLYKVVINVARNIIRKNKWERLLFNPLEQLFKSPDQQKDDLEKKEEEIMLKKAIEQLPFKLQEVIVLKYFNNFSQEEIAQILKIPVGTVKSRISSALGKIRKEVESTCLIKEASSCG